MFQSITKWRTISERGADILRIAAAQRDGETQAKT